MIYVEMMGQRNIYIWQWMMEHILIYIALKLMVQGAFGKSFNGKKKYYECLADEIIAAYNFENKSAAINKKLELERQADSSR